MIERDRADRIKSSQIVSIGGVVAVPRNDVERRMIDLARPEVTAKLCNELVRAILVLVPRDRRLKITRIRQPIRTDRPEIGEAKLFAVVLADVSAALFVVGC